LHIDEGSYGYLDITFYEESDHIIHKQGIIQAINH
jgi:hypothetical protein